MNANVPTDWRLTLEPGTKIMYRDLGGRLHEAVIVGRHNDVKNGRPGYGLGAASSQPETAWCYAEDVSGVLSYGH